MRWLALALNVAVALLAAFAFLNVAADHYDRGAFYMATALLVFVGNNWSDVRTGK